MRSFLSVLAVVALGIVSGCKPAAEAPRQGDRGAAVLPATQPAALAIYNTRCPVGKDPVDPGVETVTYDGKVWGFCCDSCVPTFKKDPAKYAAAYEAEQKK